LNFSKISKFGSISAIILSVIISWLIANVAVNYNRIELSALINFLFPQIIGGATLIVFLLIDWGFPKARFWTKIIFVVINIIIGVQIRIDSN
jgi:hypothetical protein